MPSRNSPHVCATCGPSSPKVCPTACDRVAASQGKKKLELMPRGSSTIRLTALSYGSPHTTSMPLPSSLNPALL